jgi:hypothetical protein
LSPAELFWLVCLAKTRKESSVGRSIEYLIHFNQLQNVKPNAVAILKGKADAGQGGKIGHSNQNHWGPTEEVKDAARKWRRLQAKEEIAAGLIELKLENETELSSRDLNDELPQ